MARKSPIEKKIPHVAVFFDKKALDSIYRRGISIHFRSYKTESTTEIVVKKEDTAYSDAEKIIKNELGNNFFSQNGVFDGYVLFKIDEKKHRLGVFWSIPTYLTLGVINIFGFPIVSHSVQLRANLEIYNKDFQKIASYDISSKTRRYSAFYWGYTYRDIFGKDCDVSNIARITNISAYIDCFDKFKNYLETDYNKIIDKLKNANNNALSMEQIITRLDREGKLFRLQKIN